jgi:hypothetical protein
MDNKVLKMNDELFQRWNTILRCKAEEYEHTARRNGEVVTGPDLDDLANEMHTFFIGLNNK